MKPPYPWFGGKARVAAEVWQRFGKVRNYVEPFFGGGAVLLARPGYLPEVRWTETVNDLNGWLCNFWRAVKAAPDQVAEYAADPVCEMDLHARGDWLFYRPGVDADFIERLRSDPEWYDAKSAGWWVWGQSSWIGDNWGRVAHNSRKGEDGEPCGVVHAGPHLGNSGYGVNRNLPGGGRLDRIRDYMRCLSERMEDVRVCCGDWSRVTGPCVTVCHGPTAVFLDPPYAVKDRASVYGEDDSATLAHAVRAWAVEAGENPLMRIALCGYEGEHVMPDTWDTWAWKAAGGYASRNAANENAARERIWFSPACANNYALPLFDLRGKDTP